MTMLSKVMGAGNSPISAGAILGSGTIGLVATGTNQATALQLPTSYNAITTSSSSTGVKLPKTEAGNRIIIRNDSGVTITVYPFEATGTTFDAAASSVTVANTKTAQFQALTSTYWVSLTGA